MLLRGSLLSFALGLCLSSPVQAIVGGTVDSNSLDFSFIVSIMMTGIFGDVHICGGTIVGPHTVLTAAHCLDGGSTSSLKIGVGSHDRTSLRKFKIARLVKHPNWNPSTIDSNYGIIITSENLLLGGLIVPALLPIVSSDSLTGQTAPMAGWGQTNPTSPTLPQDLQHGFSTFIDRTACKDEYKSVNSITKTMLCVKKTGLSSCNGDNGGPITDPTGLIVVGIMSYGDKDCPVGPDSLPNVASDVYPVVNWIRTNRM
ncbi:hypothetical protein TWF694_011358 [Orbilia ellipsospora]|uniref:Peptidase S1 domain-containing protein n=1 Tax=Orbilia ellipsospora TaxID=2528407 RepID=A0AAV9X688_9PEZI